MSATFSTFPINEKRHEAMAAINNPTMGVFLLGNNFDRNRTRGYAFPIVYNTREAPSILDKSELEVEKSAITAIIKAPVVPNLFSTTRARGRSESASSLNGIMLTTTNDTVT